jgi:phosphate:Na+ symporter
VSPLLTILGGLGLFFIGIGQLGGQLQALSGRRLRQALAGATRRRAGAAGAGFLLGIMTQSSNAVTFITAGMVTTGLLRLPAALPLLAWSNAGTAALVLLASVDLRLAALVLLAMAGFGGWFGLDGSARRKALLGAAASIGLIFLGLALVKQGASPLRELPLTRSLLEGALATDFLAGLLVTLVAQSSSTISILAVTLVEAGLLGFHQAAMVVYGASLGSGLAVLLFSGRLTGPARRIAVYQTGFKALGTLLFLALFLLEHLGGIPLLLAACEAAAPTAGGRIGLLFLLFQLVTALAMAPLDRPALRLLDRLVPQGAAEALSRPAYLYEQGLEDPETALELVEREQDRLLARLPAVLDGLRDSGEAAPQGLLPRETLLSANAAVEAAVLRFLDTLLQQGRLQAALDRLVALEARQALLTALRETVGEFAEAVQQGRAEPGEAMAGLLGNLTESLHMLLTELAEGDAATLLALTTDRSALMDRMRRRAATAGRQELLLRVTALFERAVWLIRRHAAASEAVAED